MPSSGRPPRAKKSLGQNFLVDRDVQRRIVDAAQLSGTDEVLEIGPGTGALSRYLAPLAGRLVLVELDDRLARSLADEFASNDRVTVVHGDILDLPLENLSRDPAHLRVIGNIPYNITTPILFSLLERRPRPRDILLMVQREVADRILAPPGGKTYGALAVGVRSVADASRVLDVGRGAFRPVPDVDSSVIRIVPRVPPRLTLDEEAALRHLVRAAFGQRRKQFQNVLRTAYSLSPDQISALERDTGFDLRDRPERFSPEDFIRLAAALPPRR